MPRTSHKSSTRRSRKISPSRSQREESSAQSRTTTDHDEIRQWAEERGGLPSCIRGTGGSDDIGMLRIEFPGKPGARDESLEEISWDEFFDKFEDEGLALVYQEETSGGQRSNFNKLVKRERARSASSGR